MLTFLRGLFFRHRLSGKRLTVMGVSSDSEETRNATAVVLTPSPMGVLFLSRNLELFDSQICNRLGLAVTSHTYFIGCLLTALRPARCLTLRQGRQVIPPPAEHCSAVGRTRSHGLSIDEWTSEPSWQFWRQTSL